MIAINKLKLFALFLCFSFGRTETNVTVQEIQSEPRIVNGQQASIFDFPWMAGVHGKSDNGNWERWRCGGALIQPNLVITAAHCADEKPREYRVILGSTLPGDSVDGDGKVIHYVKLLIKRTDADIMILKLYQSVGLTQRIRPINLPNQGQYLGSGADVTVSGWGGTGVSNSGSLSEKLLKTSLKTMTNDQCKSYYSIQPSALCYMNTYSTTCGGDSGSPVVQYMNNQAYLVAVHVGGSCQPGKPSVGVRTETFIKWIREEMARHKA